MFLMALDKTLTDIGDLDLVDYTTCENIHYEMATGIVINIHRAKFSLFI